MKYILFLILLINTSFIEIRTKCFMGQVNSLGCTIPGISTRQDIFRARIILAKDIHTAIKKFKQYVDNNKVLQSGKIITWVTNNSLMVWEIKDKDETGIIIIK